MERCQECGYIYGIVQRGEIPGALRERAADFDARLRRLEDRPLRAHPQPDTWSILEYACHVRDIFRVQRQRVRLALVQDQPTFAPMRREERVLEEQYNTQVPEVVAEELVLAADELASTFESLDDIGWTRTGVYNWPSTQVRTTEWIGLHTVHEAQHHLQDIDRLATLTAGRG